jgi:hypothetical protein
MSAAVELERLSASESLPHPGKGLVRLLLRPERLAFGCAALFAIVHVTGSLFGPAPAAESSLASGAARAALLVFAAGFGGLALAVGGAIAARLHRREPAHSALPTPAR